MKTQLNVGKLSALAIVFTATTLAPLPTHAASSTNTGSGSSMMFVGPLVGVGFLNNNGGTQIDLALDGGYKFAPELSLGAYLAYSPSSAPAGASASLYTIAAEGNYFLDRFLPGLRAGAKVGIGIASASVTVGSTSLSNSSTNLALGPQVAYDYAIGNGLSVGGEVSFIYYSSSPATNALNLLGSVKYWF